MPLTRLIVAVLKYLLRVDVSGEISEIIGTSLASCFLVGYCKKLNSIHNSNYLNDAKAATRGILYQKLFLKN